MDRSRSSADRTPVRNLQCVRTGQILFDLGNDHVGLIDRYLVSDPQFQGAQDTDVMNTCPGDRRPLKLHRVKDRYRIDQACPRRTPFNLPKMRHRLLILPFKRKCVAGRLGSPSQRVAIGDIIIQGDQSVRRDLKSLYLLSEIVKCFVQVVSCDHHMFHNLESLLFQEIKLSGAGIAKVGAFCADQCKCVKPDISLCRHLTVELSDRPAAQVSRILVLRIGIADRFIEFLKVRVRDHSLPAQYQFSLPCNLQRDIAEYSRIGSDHVTNRSVPPCDSLLKFSVTVSQDNRKSVQFPAQKDSVRSHKGTHLLPVLGLCQREHGTFMSFLRQFIHRFVTDLCGRTARKNNSCLFFQLYQFVIELVKPAVAHDLPALNIICPAGLVQYPDKFLHPGHSAVFCHSVTSACTVSLILLLDSYKSLDLPDLFPCQFSACPGRKISQEDVHDPDPLQ